MKRVFLLTNGAVVAGIEADPDEVEQAKPLKFKDSAVGFWLKDVSVNGNTVATMLFVPKDAIVSEGQESRQAAVSGIGGYDGIDN